MRLLPFVSLLLLCTTASASPDVRSRLDVYLSAADRAEPLSGVVLVAHQGRVVYTRAFGDADPEWPQPHVLEGRFRIASITKPFTAVLTLRLVQAGSTGFYLLGVIAERVTGTPYGEALREWVLEPAGLTETGYDAPGTPLRRRVRGYVRTLIGPSPAVGP